MHKLLALALSVPLLACTVGDGPGPADDPDAGPGGGTQVSGTVTTSATWSGEIDVTASTTISAGVTVTVTPGATIRIARGAAVQVRGTLDVQGTSAGTVTIGPATAGDFHGGFYIDAGGQLTLDYGVLTGGGIHIGTGGTATIADSRMSHVSGDLLTMDGGTVDMQYSQIGVGGGTDTTHCDMHFDGSPTIRITHSNITTSVYGLMFYGGTNAVFTSNNWYANSLFSVHTIPSSVSGDFTGSWFDNDKVVRAGGTNLTGIVTNPALPRNTAGPRP